MLMKELTSQYAFNQGRFDNNYWNDVVGRFDDANIYQSYPYGVVRFGQKKISHLILKRNGVVVAAAQAITLSIPLIAAGIAYVRWGPMWNVRGTEINPEIFRQAIRALRNVYAIQRGLLFRIYPVLFMDEHQGLLEILEEEGYQFQKSRTAGRTLLLDIRPSLPELRKNLGQKWRNCLNHAERNNLEVIEGESDELFGEFIGVYRDLLNRKRFPEPNDINEFRKIQKELPKERKMRIFLARSDGKTGAGAVCSAYGNKGVYLFGATNEKGMSNKGSYIIQWRILEWLKDNGCIWYDLNGINPILNPGTYRFKAGVAGKKSRDTQFLGFYDCFTNKRAHILFARGDQIMAVVQKMRKFI